MAQMNNKKNVPTLTDVASLIALGFDPRTKKPIARECESPLKDAVRRFLRIVDEQQFLSRYTWYGLPPEIPENLLERIMYYRGRGIMFFNNTDEKFYFLPFSYSKEIDCYGRFKTAVPLPFTGSSQLDDKSWMPGITKNCVWTPFLPETDEEGNIINGMTLSDFDDSCVVLTDYSLQMSQVIQSRQQLNDPIIDLEAEYIPFMRTATINSLGINGMRVNSPDEASQVAVASAGVNRAALNGDKWIPLVGSLEFQDLSSSNPADTQGILLQMQSLDNFRRMGLGLGDGTLFQTKAHELQTQADMAMGTADSVLEDGLKCRQEFCTLVNSIWGLGIWCEISETAGDYDRNGDGMVGDDKMEQQTTEGGSDDGNTMDE